MEEIETVVNFDDRYSLFKAQRTGQRCFSLLVLIGNLKFDDTHCTAYTIIWEKQNNKRLKILAMT